MLSAVAPPVRKEVERRSSRARIAEVSPSGEPLADDRDELEFLPFAPRRLARLGFDPGIAIEVASLTTSRHAPRRLALLDLPVLEWLGERRVEDRFLDLERAHSASSRERTTNSSFPRSSITLTAISREPSSVNGALTVPERWSQTESSNSPLSERLRLSQALVRGKNACETWNESPFHAVSRNHAGTSSPARWIVSKLAESKTSRPRSSTS